MALFSKEKGPVVGPGKIENVLGASTHFEGRLTSDGNVRVDGVFEGTIETAGNVIVGEQARVMADIVANGVQVWGAVKGNITATGRLEILSSGRVWGDIKVAALLIDEGGVFRGQCLMQGDGEPLLLEGPRPGEGEAEAGPPTEASEAGVAAE
ncbi:MAG: polymer-forming cytoskeletal protein [Anaerolineae bacterium]|nr:polymer-forming cytoskeletal protein [Anaerolineae bacterium]